MYVPSAVRGFKPWKQSLGVGTAKTFQFIYVLANLRRVEAMSSVRQAFAFHV